ncbi:hypothetical protein [Peloplasma aerotolerans]|uniref:Uncharacterized protein n=1 Tax=Peloplasma aerotolerans TaxID=3044389 RepID=A0AAW6U5D2_9MOLU|nr:hypothetical protein [Mariniplasma sp. M4Ah]MDI6453122.1 hypothetical protein [Mariniplasma sp. M4Ah]
MQFIRKYTHVILLILGLLLLFIGVFMSSRLFIINNWGRNQFFILLLTHLSSYMEYSFFVSPNFYWIAIYTLLIVATYPKEMESCKIEELVFIAIGFLIGYNIFSALNIPNVGILQVMIRLIEPLSIVLILVLLIVYVRHSDYLSKRKMIIFKFTSLMIALMTFIYRLIYWNFILGYQSIYWISVQGGILIIGVMIFIFLNRDHIEINTSKKSLYNGLWMITAIPFVMYALRIATLYKYPNTNGFPLIYLLPIEYTIHVFYIHLLAFCFYMWVICRSVFNLFSMRKSLLVISIVLPASWVVFGFLAVFIFQNYWLYSIPIYLMIIIGLFILFNDLKLIINYKRRSIQQKEIIELN